VLYNDMVNWEYTVQKERMHAEMTRWKLYLTGCLALLLMAMAVAVPAQAANGFLPVREHEGVIYEARPAAELTTILLIGYDHHADGQEEELHGYSNGGQSDFLLLMVLDHVEQQIRMLQINRDTMAEVKLTDYKGRQLDPRWLQICLAHAYGNTREKNNANTIWSVERLLRIEGKKDGAQVDWYVAMDISGITRLNDLLGGVTVTLTDDMTNLDPVMEKGARIRLMGRQAEYFVRGRYHVGDKTNASRMERQKQYLESAADQLKARMRENADFAAQLLNDMGVIYDKAVDSDNPFARQDEGTPTGEEQGRYLMSSETVSGMVNALGRCINYEVLPTERLPGVLTQGADRYMRFEVEENAGLEWALSVFYRVAE